MFTCIFIEKCNGVDLRAFASMKAVQTSTKIKRVVYNVKSDKYLANELLSVRGNDTISYRCNTTDNIRAQKHHLQELLDEFRDAEIPVETLSNICNRKRRVYICIHSRHEYTNLTTDKITNLTEFAHFCISNGHFTS